MRPQTGAEGREERNVPLPAGSALPLARTLHLHLRPVVSHAHIGRAKGKSAA